MQLKGERRVHGAHFKARVLAECWQPGTSVAAVALADVPNVNLVRKWLVGRGLKRTGLAAPRTATHLQSADSAVPPSLQFVAVVDPVIAEIAGDANPITSETAVAQPDVCIELRQRPTAGALAGIERRGLWRLAARARCRGAAPLIRID